VQPREFLYKRGFLCKAGVASWLGRADDDGNRGVVFHREHADTFQTYESANVASRRLIAVLKDSAVMFLVEQTG
jgi:hypothetical protein